MNPVSGILALPMSGVSVIHACTNITLSFNLNVFLLLLIGCAISKMSLHKNSGRAVSFL